MAPPRFLIDVLNEPDMEVSAQPGAAWCDVCRRSYSDRRNRLRCPRGHVIEFVPLPLSGKPLVDMDEHELAAACKKAMARQAPSREWCQRALLSVGDRVWQFGKASKWTDATLGTVTEVDGRFGSIKWDGGAVDAWTLLDSRWLRDAPAGAGAREGARR